MDTPFPSLNEGRTLAEKREFLRHAICTVALLAGQSKQDPFQICTFTRVLDGLQVASVNANVLHVHYYVSYMKNGEFHVAGPWRDLNVFTFTEDQEVLANRSIIVHVMQYQV